MNKDVGWGGQSRGMCDGGAAEADVLPAAMPVRKETPESTFGCGWIQAALEQKPGNLSTGASPAGWGRCPQWWI